MYIPLHFSMGSKVIRNNCVKEGEPGDEATLDQNSHCVTVRKVDVCKNCVDNLHGRGRAIATI